jgi:hypothetical protein
MKTVIPIMFCFLFLSSPLFAQQLSMDSTFFGNAYEIYNIEVDFANNEQSDRPKSAIVDEDVSFLTAYRTTFNNIDFNRVIKKDNNDQANSPQIWYSFSTNTPRVDLITNTTQGLLTAQTTDSSIILTMIDVNSSNTLVNGFGTNGVSSIISPSSAGIPTVTKIIENTDGSFLLVGRTYNISNQVDSVLVSKVGANGTLDTNFGNNGFLVVNSINTSLDYTFGTPVDAFTLPDGKLLVLGRYTLLDTFIVPNEFYYYNFLYRVNPDGSLDNTFANNGFRSFNFGQGALTSIIANMQLVEDNSLFIYGTTRTSTTSNFSLCITKLDSTGSLEPWTAGGNSRLINNLSLNNLDIGKAMMHTDGRIYLAGRFNQQIGNPSVEGVLVVNNDGSINTNVNTNGIYETGRIASSLINMDIIAGKIIMLAEGEYTGAEFPYRTSRLNLSPSTNINLLNNNSDIKLFPNPTTSVLNIEAAAHQIEAIRVMDLSGKLVADFYNINQQINLDFLQQGIYMIQVQTEKGISNHKIQVLD